MSGPDLHEIAPSLFWLRHPHPEHRLNSYVWLGDTPQDGVTLVDCGWPGSAPYLEAALGELGRSRDDVVRLVLTHFHEDHAGSAADVAGWSARVQVLAGRDDADVVEGTAPGEIPTLTPAELAMRGGEPFREPPAAPPCPVHQRLDDGDVLPFGGGARVLAVPGHTAGSIAVHLPAADTVLTGDTVAEHAGQVIAGAFHVDRAGVHRALGVIAATGAARAGFGHGDPVVDGAARAIAEATDPLGEANAD